MGELLYLVGQLKLALEKAESAYTFSHAPRRWYWLLARYEGCCGATMEVFEAYYKSSRLRAKGLFGVGCVYCGKVRMTTFSDYAGGTGGM